MSHTTAEDVRIEHEAALASLTPQQQRAIDRLRRARQRSHFNHLWPTENLEVLFELEAHARNERRDVRQAA